MLCESGHSEAAPCAYTGSHWNSNPLLKLCNPLIFWTTAIILELSNPQESLHSLDESNHSGYKLFWRGYTVIVLLR